MKNKYIRITFPMAILIEVFSTWFIGQFNETIGIFIGFVSAFHILIMYIIGQVLKNKAKENERVN